ncbi:MAG: hypothetical protein M3Q60_13710 [Actinomycetota bacterium]|nr:hypothetical protein [Actinomycetota bacterium]
MTENNDVQQSVQDLRHDLDVQAATQAGAQATQAATQAGAQATQAATQVGQAATQAAAVSGLAAAVAAGFVCLVVGTLLGIAIAQSNNHNH